MDVSRIPPRSKDGYVYVLVEIPRGSQNKYELHRDLGVIMFDRALYSATHYPTEYGLVPGTRSSKEIEHFFAVYKDLEGSEIGICGWRNAQEAQKLLDDAIDAYEREGAEA